MRVEPLIVGYRVVLSKRNLLALLSKLEMPDSACTLYVDDFETVIYVSAEEDDQHYLGRRPGPMHPHTERDIKGGDRWSH